MTTQSMTPVGFIISWKVPAIVDLAQLRAGLTAAGCDPLLAADLRPSSLVARTASYVAKATSTGDARKLARPIAHTERQITREETVGGGLTYTREAGIGYDETTGDLTVDDPKLLQDVEAGGKVVTDTRTASDVTRLVQHIVSDEGSDLIPVREQGGAYFVPSGHGIISKVDTLLTHIGGSLTRFACTIGHGSDESIANVITDYLLKQIGELRTSIEELNEAGIRADVKSRRLTRVAELRERLGAYASLVQAHGTKLSAELDTAEAALLAKLGEREQGQLDGVLDTPAAPAAPAVPAGVGA